MSKLDVIHVELTNKCQLSCSCCGDKKTRPRGFMSLSNYHKIAVQIYELNKNAGIRLFLSGDPLLHPQIDEVCRLSTEMELKNTMIHTNGYSLTETLAKKLVRSGLKQISFSLDSYHIAKNDRGRLMGWISADNVKTFIKVNQKYGSPVHVIVQALVTNRWTVTEYKKLYEQHFPGVDQTVIKRPHSWDRKGSVEGAGRSNKHICKFLKNRAAVCWNGDAVICCADLNGRMVIGNLFEGFPLIEIVQQINEIGDCFRRGEKVDKDLPCYTCEKDPE